MLPDITSSIFSKPTAFHALHDVPLTHNARLLQFQVDRYEYLEVRSGGTAYTLQELSHSPRHPIMLGWGIEMSSLVIGIPCCGRYLLTQTPSSDRNSQLPRLVVIEVMR